MPLKSLMICVVLGLATAQTNNPWSDSVFGEWEKEGSNYRQAGYNDVRHIGWSWSPIRTMTPPCSTTYNVSANADPLWLSSSCVSTKDQCEKVGGWLFQNICMEDPDKPFSVLGPGCWNKTCSDPNNSEDVCENTLGGFYVRPDVFGLPDASRNNTAYGGSWCFVPGRHTVLGPACYGTDCFTEELQKVCTSLSGTVYADYYCLMDDKYSVIGPICRPDTNATACFPEDTVAKCQSLGGKTVGDIFCILEGEYSVLGPFCYGQLGGNYTDCFADDGVRVCNSLNGTSFGEGLFCAIPQSGYQVFADFYGGGYIIGDFQGDETSTCVSKLGGMNLGPYSCVFNGDFTAGVPAKWSDTTFFNNQRETDDIMAYSGIGFVLRGLYTIYGPNCYGSQCYPAALDCEKAGGKSISGILCAMPKSSSIRLSGSSLSVGTIAVLSVLSALLFLETMVMLFWWHKRINMARETAADEQAKQTPSATIPEAYVNDETAG